MTMMMPTMTTIMMVMTQLPVLLNRGAPVISTLSNPAAAAMLTVSITNRGFPDVLPHPTPHEHYVSPLAHHRCRTITVCM